MIQGVALAFVWSIQPPANPTAQEIIDKLSTSSNESMSLGSRTRSFRNLEPTTKFIDLNVQFEFNSADLTADSVGILRELVIALSSDRLRGLRFLVEGHTDAKGSADYNIALSARRARAVAQFLVSHGIQEKRLLTTGRGFSDLLNAGEPYAPENRRVRIVADAER
jgi:outer membrane protein OmpA-like peptidoglycan-associated protein